MKITIGTRFKIVDENGESFGTTDISFDIDCTDKELTTEKVYQTLKDRVKKSIPDKYTVEDLTDEEYEKAKEED